MTRPASTPRSNRPRLLACAAGLLAGAVYLNALHNPFVYDDDHTVVANTSIQNLRAIRAIVLHDMTRPLVNLSYAVDHAVWGAGPLGFHVTSVLLHMVNVVLFFSLVRRLVEDRQDGIVNRAEGVSPELVAFAAAALFAVHPMMTEAVGYISGRSEVLCATWFLSGLLCGRRWIRGQGSTIATEITPATQTTEFTETTPTNQTDQTNQTNQTTEITEPSVSSVVNVEGAVFGSTRKDLLSVPSVSSVVDLKWAVFTIGFWVAALATKESAVMFPFVLAAYDWLAIHGHAEERRRRILRVHLPLLAVVLLVGLARVAVFARVEYPGQVKVHWLYILLQLDVVGRYLGLIVNPTGQAIFHEVSSVGGLTEPRALVAIGSVGAIVLLGWTLRRREWLGSFGVFWFLLLLVPSSALIVLDQGEPMTEHRVYLASCGVFLAAGVGIGWLARRIGRTSVRSQPLAAAALALVLLSFAAETVTRNAVWASPVGLWRESVDLAPGHFRPRLLLGEALEDVGRREEAIEQFRTAIRLRPTESTGYLKLGRGLADLGRLDEAAATFGELQAIDPRSAVASSGLAVVAMLAGQPARARQHFLETIAIDPQNVPARQSLARLDETTLANPTEALRLCEEIRRLAPGTAGNDDCIQRNRFRTR